MSERKTYNPGRSGKSPNLGNHRGERETQLFGNAEETCASAARPSDTFGLPPVLEGIGESWL
jgi:hypothetical protein